MAMKFKAGKVRRSDVFHVDPFEINVSEELRGRHKPPPVEAIQDMALSILTYGQRQPVECRRKDGRLQLVLGFTRTNAVRMIREGFDAEVDGETKHFGDPDFTLKVVVVEGNDKDAFIRNIVENAHRNETSPIDDAHNQARLRDRYGMADVEIARLYHYNSGAGKVSKLKGLLELSEAIQSLVHEGRMGVDQALALRKVPEKERPAIIKEAQTEAGVNGQQVRKAIRERILRDPPDEPKESTDQTEPEDKGAPPLTVREVRLFFEGVVSSGEFTNEVKAFARVAVAWIKGQKGDKAMGNAINKLAKKD